MAEPTRTDSPTDAVVQKIVRVINGNLTTGISMGQPERYADEDTALAVIAALHPITDSPTDAVERLREALSWIAETCRDEMDCEYTERMRKILLRNLAEAAEAALRDLTDGETK